ncbi:MAG: hypothetical protein WCN92_05440 [Eubacteriales bacterium]
MKKLLSLILVVSLLAGNFSFAASAKASALAQTDLKNISKSVTATLDYFVGSVKHTKNISKTNAAVLKMIKSNAGEDYILSASSVLDKNHMIPHSQQYYQPGVPGGICNKAAAMMILSYYRDGLGYSKLPNDKVMYKQISDMYNSITKAFPKFFNNKLMKEQFDTTKSYEMLGTFEMGLAYYLYSKGYTNAAQNVIDNISCKILQMPDAAGNSILKFLMAYFSTWIEKQTNGELKLSTDIKARANDIILNSLKNKEPVIIGCLAAIGNDIYAVHYFVGVGYYKMDYNVRSQGKPLHTFSKEYIEVYDTWGNNSSVVNWTVFKNTALFSAISLADAG